MNLSLEIDYSILALFPQSRSFLDKLLPGLGRIAQGQLTSRILLPPLLANLFAPILTLHAADSILLV
jgi:hypothetical protein